MNKYRNWQPVFIIINKHCEFPTHTHHKQIIMIIYYQKQNEIIITFSTENAIKTYFKAKNAHTHHTLFYLFKGIIAFSASNLILRYTLLSRIYCIIFLMLLSNLTQKGKFQSSWNKTGFILYASQQPYPKPSS